LSDENNVLSDDSANENSWPKYAKFVISELDTLDKRHDQEVEERFLLSKRVDAAHDEQTKINHDTESRINKLQEDTISSLVQKIHDLEIKNLKKNIGAGSLGGALTLIVTEIVKFLNSHPEIFKN